MKAQSYSVLVVGALFLCITGCKENNLTEPASSEAHVDLESCKDVDLSSDESVPATLDAALTLLEARLSEQDRKAIEEMTSEDDMSFYHFGAGMGMRNGWGLWGESPLAIHMRDLGFTHADDMSSVILESLWCKIHNKPYRIQEKVEYYKAYWKENSTPPETATDPQDGAEVVWDRSFGAEGRLHRTIHLGRSVKTNRWLAYEHTVGVYLPDKKIQKVIDDWDKETEADPFGEE